MSHNILIGWLSHVAMSAPPTPTSSRLSRPWSLAPTSRRARTSRELRYASQDRRYGTQYLTNGRLPCTDLAAACPSSPGLHVPAYCGTSTCTAGTWPSTHSSLTTLIALSAAVRTCATFQVQLNELGRVVNAGDCFVIKYLDLI